MDSDDRRALRELFSTASVEHFDKSETILHAGEAPEHIWLVRSGFVKAYTISETGECRIIAIRGIDELLPLESVYSVEPSTVFYEAISPVRLRKLPKAAVESAIRSNAALMKAALMSTLTTLREYNQRLQNLEVGDARHRIVARLLYLRRRFGCVADKNGLVLRIPVTHQDLADALNLSRETANREFSALIREGVVEKRRGAVVLKSPGRLQAILEGTAAI